MKLLAEETVDLPVYEQSIASATPGLQPIEETATSPTDSDPGQYRIRETRADSGIVSVTVVHLVDGETRARYRFDVIDFDQRICRYTGSDDPPWSVYCAVTRFGYHCQTAPESSREYTFDLLAAASIELINQIDQVDDPFLAGALGRIAHQLHSYLHLITAEVQVGADQMTSLSERVGDGETIAEQLFGALEASDVSDPFLPHALGHPSTAALLSQGSTANSSDEDGSDPPDSTDDAPETEPVAAADIVGARGRGDRADELYVHRITADAIDRFSFHITDDDAATCVAQTDVVGDLPPYGVIEFVTDEYTITNLPSFTGSDLSQAERLLAVDRVVRKAVSQATPESAPVQRVFDDYIRELTLVFCIAAAYEVAPTAYARATQSVFDQLGVPLQTQTLSQLEFEDLDQITSAALMLVDESEADAIRSRSRDLLASARVEDRHPTDTDEAPDLRLLGQLVDFDPSVHDDRPG